MSFEHVPFSFESKKFQFLSEKDQEILRETGRRIIELLDKDFSRGLPEAVIFPDTTARPLAHMFLPMFRKLADERKEEVPAIYFFKQFHGQEPNKERAKEILDFEGKGSSIKELLALFGKYDELRLAIIDEYVSDEAHTIGGIRAAFGNTVIPAYALIGQVTEFPESSKIRVGLLDPYASRPGRLSTGFNFRHSAAIGVMKARGLMYVQRNEKVDDDMAKLRADMKTIGEEIAGKL